MSSISPGALPVTGAGVVIAGTAFGVQWVAAAGAALVVAGVVAFRIGHKVRAKAR
jgi:hypothetical protein